jgi:hypothetical protein
MEYYGIWKKEYFSPSILSLSYFLLQFSFLPSLPLAHSSPRYCVCSAVHCRQKLDFLAKRLSPSLLFSHTICSMVIPVMGYGMCVVDRVGLQRREW